MKYFHRFFFTPPNRWREVLLSPVLKLKSVPIRRSRVCKYTNRPVNILLTTKNISDDKPKSSYSSKAILIYFMSHVTNSYNSRNYISKAIQWQIFAHRCYEMDETYISLFETIEPRGQLWANTSSRVSQFHEVGVPTFYSKVNVFTVCAYNYLEMHY